MTTRKLAVLIAAVIATGVVMTVADIRDWTALTAYLVLAGVAVPAIVLGTLLVEGTGSRRLSGPRKPSR